MKRLLLVSAALFLSSPVQAQNCCVVTAATSSTCGNCATFYVGGSSQPDESVLASWAARKAVESQQSKWWNERKVSDLTREEVDQRTERLTALKVWAKTLSNHIFSTAYIAWADERLAALNGRRSDLDKLDVALSLVRGLPTPPEGK